MELDLTYILDISVLERSIGYFPNIQRLVLHSCWIAVNLRMIVDSLPQLETLVLISVNGLNYSKKCLYPPPSPSPLSSSLSMLKELAILEFRAGKQLALTSEFWQFVAQKLPKLEALKLYDCEHREDTIVAHSTQHGLAIRTLVAKMEEKQLVKLVSVLPKLHVLKLMTSSAEECIKWQKLYPRLKVERSHAIRDFT
ncbi:hypothetical protein GQ42DRAFT_2568 [Ramicandelaber brevisporus]|nr:hypothetical protein GQ42DRAFT_2568 [Ramicandelaber brevisporus]